MNNLNTAHLQVDIKEKASLVIEVSLTKYDSNSLAETNFLTDDSGITAGSLSYYRVSLCAWDYENNQANENAAFEFAS